MKWGELGNEGGKGREGFGGLRWGKIQTGFRTPTHTNPGAGCAQPGPTKGAPPASPVQCLALAAALQDEGNCHLRGTSDENYLYRNVSTHVSFPNEGQRMFYEMTIL